VIASTGPTALWYLTRGTGVVALLLLTASVVLGIAGPLRTRPRALLAALHRNVPLLAIAFVAAHVVTTVADGFAPIGLKDAVVPFLSPYRPLWLGLGAVAFDLLLALVATSLLRVRIGLRGWRAVHWLAYASWPVALAHSLGTGSDGRAGWFVGLAFASTLLVAAAVLARVLRAPTLVGGKKLVMAGAVPAVVLLLAGWAETGPLRQGWAQRAGTPSSLLAVPASHGVLAAHTPSAQPQQPRVALPYTAAVSGSLSQSPANGSGVATVDIEAQTSGPVRGKLRATLYGIPLDGGGLSLQSSDVAYATAGAPGAYRGNVVGLEGTHIVAVVRDGRGRRLQLDLRLQIDRGGNVGGRLRVHHPEGPPA
jgi:sulfoxide reductase heme-binding subunit YedZ